MVTTLALFEQRGFYGVSVSDIASACGIARGSLYTYFKNKKDLVNALYIHWKGILFEFTREDLDGLSGRAKHKKMWENLFRFAREHPFALSFLESQQHASYLSPEAIQLSRSIEKFAERNYADIVQSSHNNPLAMETLLSMSFGSYVQVAKMAKLEILPLSDDVCRMVEDKMWQMLNSHPVYPTEVESLEKEALKL